MNNKTDHPESILGGLYFVFVKLSYWLFTLTSLLTIYFDLFQKWGHNSYCIVSFWYIKTNSPSILLYSLYLLPIYPIWIQYIWILSDWVTIRLGHYPIWIYPFWIVSSLDLSILDSIHFAYSPIWTIYNRTYSI